MAEQVETVAPRVGMPCARCLLHRDSTASRPTLSAGTYREWGWPVTVRGKQVLLTLGFEVTALVLPDRLAEAVTAVLAGRDHPTPALVNPGAPEDWVLVVGEPYGVPLPWPPTVRPLTGTLPLPPSKATNRARDRTAANGGEASTATSRAHNRLHGSTPDGKA